MTTKMKRFLGILLSLALVLGLVPGMSLTALAWDGDPYAALLNTTTVVKFDNKNWYLIENNSTAVDAGTVTLLSKECVASSMYDSNGSNTYSGSTVESTVNNWYTQNITANAQTAVVDNKMFLLTKDQAYAITNGKVRECSEYSGTDGNIWWLCSPAPADDDAMCVNGYDGYVYDDGYKVDYWWFGVRPALKLNLSSVIFSSSDNTFTAKQVPTVTAPTAKTLTYTGQAQELVNAGSTTGGTMNYALGTDATTAPTSGWGTSIPTGTDVGT